MGKSEKAKYGIELLCEAVIEVLKNADKPLTPAQISHALDIPPFVYEHVRGRDYAITHGILAKLAMEDKVKYSIQPNTKRIKVWEIKRIDPTQ